jgi:hypothetical protein
MGAADDELTENDLRYEQACEDGVTPSCRVCGVRADQTLRDGREVYKPMLRRLAPRFPWRHVCLACDIRYQRRYDRFIDE